MQPRPVPTAASATAPPPDLIVRRRVVDRECIPVARRSTVVVGRGHRARRRRRRRRRGARGARSAAIVVVGGGGFVPRVIVPRVTRSRRRIAIRIPRGIVPIPAIAVDVAVVRRSVDGTRLAPPRRRRALLLCHPVIRRIRARGIRRCIVAGWIIPDPRPSIGCAVRLPPPGAHPSPPAFVIDVTDGRPTMIMMRRRRRRIRRRRPMSRYAIGNALEQFPHVPPGLRGRRYEQVP